MLKEVLEMSISVGKRAIIGWLVSVGSVGQPVQIYNQSQLHKYEVAYLDKGSGAYLIIDGDEYNYGYVMSMWGKSASEKSPFRAKISDCKVKYAACKDIGLVKIASTYDAGLKSFELDGTKIAVRAVGGKTIYSTACNQTPSRSTAAGGARIIAMYRYVLDKSGNLLSLYIVYTHDNNGEVTKVFLEKISTKAFRI